MPAREREVMEDLKMVKQQSKKNFRRSIMRLDETQLRRMMDHRKKGTPLLCGEDAYLYTRSDGGG